ncbi:MAG: hypothetical protein E5Y06_30570, partial [Mesorhizobium sp.]
PAAPPPAPAPKPATQPYQSTNVTPLPAYGSANANVVKHAPPPSRQDSIDDTLMRELEVSLDQPRSGVPAGKPAAKAPQSLDDEMTKLLGELSSQKK